MHYDAVQAKQAGYFIRVCSPFHFQVKKTLDSPTIINVWPTAKKILKQYEPGPAPYYHDILQALEKEFAPIGPYEELKTLEEWTAHDEVVKFRKNPLIYIKELKEKHEAGIPI